MRQGAQVEGGETRFAVRSPRAETLWLCRFDGDRESRIAMAREGDLWTVTLPGDLAGTCYGYRAAGEWNPQAGLWFDPSKLLVDPHARELDRSFVQDPALATYGADTAAIVPRAIVPAPVPDAPHRPPVFARGGLVYEVNVRGFTMCHPDVPPPLRGTVAALAHPAVLAHLRKLRVAAVELMPVVAWIDERHLPPLGLSNAWGYNPVAPMALDPRLCPGGVAELRDTVATLHAEGIGVLLDIVLNHTGESDMAGGVLCLRGLDDTAHAREPDGNLSNHTGCGNTLDFGHGWVRELALDTLRHFVGSCGIDGFRFDLAPVLARGPHFDARAPFFAEIAADPLLADRVLVAEPWDCGPGGYRLGQFPANWLEWNDRFRDEVRRFWRGDLPPGPLATRMAGSADVFGEGSDRSVNFVAAHDGFTLADTVAFSRRHNEANGEGNRDGHSGEVSWNGGVEGPTDDAELLERRDAAIRAMLATLFLSAGTPLLTAGDESGRTQRGNNNAYAQDNETTWLDWDRRDRALEDYVATLSAWRADRLALLRGFVPDGEWRRLDGLPMTIADWEDHASPGFAWSGSGLAFRVDRRERSANPD